jgi:hypothetical protein
LVLLGKYERLGWVKIPPEDIPKRAKPSGAELPENKSLYLVKTQHGGSDVIGKYLTE